MCTEVCLVPVLETLPLTFLQTLPPTIVWGELPGARWIQTRKKGSKAGSCLSWNAFARARPPLLQGRSPSAGTSYSCRMSLFYMRASNTLHTLFHSHANSFAYYFRAPKPPTAAPILSFDDVLGLIAGPTEPVEDQKPDLEVAGPSTSLEDVAGPADDIELLVQETDAATAEVLVELPTDGLRIKGSNTLFTQASETEFPYLQPGLLRLHALLRQNDVSSCIMKPDRHFAGDGRF